MESGVWNGYRILGYILYFMVRHIVFLDIYSLLIHSKHMSRETCLTMKYIADASAF